MNRKHQYITLSDQPKTGSNSYANSLLIKFYLSSVNQPINKWKRDKKKYNVHWTDMNSQNQTSVPINYLDISKFIRENGYFDDKHFNLPPTDCFWLDFSLNVKINWHTFDHTTTDGVTIHDGVPQQIYGNNYPIKPRLNREGHAFTTLQPQLMNRIMSNRLKLINNSAQALTDDWFFDLRTLISDTVSLVEITLTQFYIKAEFDPFDSWKFSKSEVGERHGRRFEEKMNWIYKITGNHINAEKYLSSFNLIRELRNHFMHFDPPSLVITIEEATIWLNKIIDVGYLLIKLREAMNANISIQLINYILQKEAIFNPELHFSQRLPLDNPNTGYASSTWGKDATNTK